MRQPRSDPDIYPLMIADALLSGGQGDGHGRRRGLGRSARLYRALVQTDIAAWAGSYFRLTRDPHLFQFSATAKPGQPWEESLRAIEAAIYREIDQLAQELPPGARVGEGDSPDAGAIRLLGRERHRLGYIFGWLEVVASADLYTQFLDRLAQVTPEDVQRVVRAYLKPDNRTVGWFVPEEPAGEPPALEGAGRWRQNGAN